MRKVLQKAIIDPLHLGVAGADADYIIIEEQIALKIFANALQADALNVKDVGEQMDDLSRRTQFEVSYRYFVKRLVDSRNGDSRVNDFKVEPSTIKRKHRWFYEYNFLYATRQILLLQVFTQENRAQSLPAGPVDDGDFAAKGIGRQVVKCNAEFLLVPIRVSSGVTVQFVFLRKYLRVVLVAIRQ